MGDFTDCARAVQVHHGQNGAGDPAAAYGYPGSPLQPQRFMAPTQACAAMGRRASSTPYPGRHQDHGPQLPFLLMVTAMSSACGARAYVVTLVHRLGVGDRHRDERGEVHCCSASVPGRGGVLQRARRRHQQLDDSMSSVLRSATTSSVKRYDPGSVMPCRVAVATCGDGRVVVNSDDSVSGD